MQCAWGWGNRKEKRKEKEKKEGKERASLTGKGEGCHPQGSGNSGAHLSAPLLSQKSGPKQTHLLFEDTWSHLGPQPQHAGGKGTEGSLTYFQAGNITVVKGPRGPRDRNRPVSTEHWASGLWFSVKVLSLSPFTCSVISGLPYVLSPGIMVLS